ncbi:4'-phosphopantetheinyl transferase superfamily protein [Shewanella psychropiezotolerans]|uniref:Enterobactin synthase component D n=1 Tax=Shewanella psychropiezotolerans TaxID=2593655 RepID=A0ABX5WYA1_9GAMM|nr:MULTISPECIES: 4'-phosphopantetheinyl transferase superfamily protein [Shewanella]MPY23779.1 4'-phosphopantetheinyl transferase superfamily protein [Shewanella sp. YLB-07]QDO84087.1 4'-phosphopantetheinyl transferase superfamily protein [Shewanella psychropiezotolerans]
MANNEFVQKIENKSLLELKLATWSKTSYAASNYDERLFLQYNFKFPSELKGAVPKRCAEFLAGRLVARQALQQLTNEPHQVLSAYDRAPIWPSGIIGSITHTSTQAIAVTAYRRHHQIIGVDLENWIETEVAREISSEIIDSRESELITHSKLEFNQGLTLLFSAKESLYKALYPKVKYFFGFECAQVNTVDIDTGQFFISLTCDLNNDYPKGWGIKGRFLQEKDTILTLING